MTVFSLSARLYFGANSNRALSLPQSFVVAKRRQKPAPSSEGAEAAPPQTAEFASVSTGEPRTRSICLCGTAPSKCVRTAHTPKHFAPKGAKYITHAAGVLHVAKPRFIRRSRAYAATACSAAARFDVNTPSFIATALREALPPAKPLRSTVALPPTAFTAEEE